ncbi:MAG: AI-2E family transporter [Thermodesulfobacteriota bacterium]
MNRKIVFDLFILVCLLILLYLLVKLTSSFLIPIFWAAVLALSTYPIYKKLKKILKERANLSALIMTFFTSCLLLVPILFLLINLGIEAFDFYNSTKDKGEIVNLRPNIEKFVSEKKWKHLIPDEIRTQLESKFNIEDIDIASITSKALIKISNKLLNLFQNTISNIYLFILNFGFTVFSLFFFYRDGAAFSKFLIEIVPMKDSDKTRIFSIFAETIKSIVMGSLAIAAVQGILITLIFTVLSMPYPIFSGAISFILSILPLVGATIVWLPVSIYLLIIGSYAKGIILFIFGAVIISSVDNVLRPIIIGGKLKLNTLFLFISILGGLELFGFSGLLIGPLIIALLISFIEIYKIQFITQPDFQIKL